MITFREFILLENYFNISKKLKITNPLFHATGLAAIKIVDKKEGLKTGQGSNFGSGNANGISMTRDFSVVSRGKFGHTILVCSRDELKTKFKIEQVNYFGDRSEKEERIITNHIPVKFIKAMIILTSPIANGKEFAKWNPDVKYFWWNDSDLIQLPIEK